MDWLIGVLLLVVGGIIGFFVSKFVSEQNTTSTDKVDNEQTIKELMAQQASSHVQETKQIAQQLAAQSESLNQQISAYEQLLIAQSTGADDSALSYFGEHATAYLQNKVKTPARQKSTAEVQPLDFASQSGSGLFSGAEEPKVSENK